MSHKMKTIFDLMRTDAAFREKARESLSHCEDPILHAVDHDTPIGDIVSMSRAKGQELYVFVLKNGGPMAGFSMSPGHAPADGEEQSQDDAPAPIHPKAPIDMVLGFARKVQSLNFVVTEEFNEDVRNDVATSHLVLS